ncbi:MAG: thiamine biosynthesis protein ThiF [Sulfurimonas sp.]|uniref:thiamine biosynthesis protein ThiF n=1 Tax=Sulfurimonas sp. TaxID=2022749 RepID=UPI0025DCF5E6|nr:thiamine biosynthesis protein ThiF [Sulfurimonas sp.]MCK9454380.1 thiamine biosynthesis protein ThiF [Sulfurimonas sp.]
MISSFDLSNPLVCEGIIGDGCGGGRIFFIDNETLYAHDPLSKENRELLKNIKKAKKISKKGCLITIECKDEKIEFDLSRVSAG